jgi:hypothetical protein
MGERKERMAVNGYGERGIGKKRVESGEQRVVEEGE